MVIRVAEWNGPAQSLPNLCSVTSVGNFKVATWLYLHQEVSKVCGSGLFIYLFYLESW